MNLSCQFDDVRLESGRTIRRQCDALKRAVTRERLWE